MDRRLVYGGPSPPLFPRAWSTRTGFMHGWPARGVSPVSSPVAYTPVVSSLVHVSFARHLGGACELREASAGTVVF